MLGTSAEPISTYCCVILFKPISTKSLNRFSMAKLTQFWQSNTSHTVTKQAKAMFWHLHIVSQIVWIRVCFLCRGKKSRARTTSGPSDRITLKYAFLFSFLPSFFFHNPWHASAPQICVMFWVMISSLLWLTSYTGWQASNTQVVGEMGSTPAHTSSWWGLCTVCMEGRGDSAVWEEGKCLHLAGLCSLLFLSLLLFSSLFSWLLCQSQEFMVWPKAELVNYYHVFNTPGAN